jgi:hypothetical protein
MNLISKETQLNNLDAEIQVKTEEYFDIVSNVNEKVKELSLVKEQTRIAQATLEKINKSIAVKASDDANFNAVLTQQANEQLQLANELVAKLTTDRAEFDTLVRKELETIANMKKELAIEIRKNQRQNEIKEVALSAHRANHQARVSKMIEDGKVDDRIAVLDRRISKNEKLLAQLTRTSQDIDIKLESIKVRELELAAQRGEIGTLMKLYANR